MKCKFCNAQMEEGATVCPACGEDNTVQKKKGKTALIIVVAVALVAALGITLWLGISGGSGNSGETMPLAQFDGTESADETEAAQTPAEPTEPAEPAEPTPVQVRDSYTAADLATVQSTADDVITKIGDYELTNGELQIFYWMQVYDFLNYYGDTNVYDYFTLDYTQPLDQQFVDETISKTWQHYFLENAISNWQKYKVLQVEADKAEYTMSDDLKAFIDGTHENLAQMASSSGYASVEEMLTFEMGEGATEQSYMKYLNTFYFGNEYYETARLDMMPTEAEIEAYFEENASEYAQQGVTKDSGSCINVRHILLIPEGTSDATGATTYSDADWEACRQKAQKILDEWLAGEATEESFASLAYNYSEDPGSKNNGGLYSGVMQGEMVEEFDTWCFDMNRKYGDYELVKTSYGYHIMFFVGMDQLWHNYASQDLTADMAVKQLDAWVAQYDTEIAYDKIQIGIVNLGGVADQLAE